MNLKPGTILLELLVSERTRCCIIMVRRKSLMNFFTVGVLGTPCCRSSWLILMLSQIQVNTKSWHNRCLSLTRCCISSSFFSFLVLEFIFISIYDDIILVGQVVSIYRRFKNCEKQLEETRGYYLRFACLRIS